MQRKSSPTTQRVDSSLQEAIGCELNVIDQMIAQIKNIPAAKKRRLLIVKKHINESTIPALKQKNPTLVNLTLLEEVSKDKIIEKLADLRIIALMMDARRHATLAGVVAFQTEAFVPYLGKVGLTVAMIKKFNELTGAQKTKEKIQEDSIDPLVLIDRHLKLLDDAKIEQATLVVVRDEINILVKFLQPTCASLASYPVILSTQRELLIGKLKELKAFLSVLDKVKKVQDSLPPSATQNDLMRRADISWKDMIAYIRLDAKFGDGSLRKVGDSVYRCHLLAVRELKVEAESQVERLLLETFRMQLSASIRILKIIEKGFDSILTKFETAVVKKSDDEEVDQNTLWAEMMRNTMSFIGGRSLLNCALFLDVFQDQYQSFLAMKTDDLRVLLKKELTQLDDKSIDEMMAIVIQVRTAVISHAKVYFENETYLDEFCKMHAINREQLFASKKKILQCFTDRVIQEATKTKDERVIESARAEASLMLKGAALLQAGVKPDIDLHDERLVRPFLHKKEESKTAHEEVEESKKAKNNKKAKAKKAKKDKEAVSSSSSLSVPESAPSVSLVADSKATVANTTNASLSSKNLFSSPDTQMTRLISLLKEVAEPMDEKKVDGRQVQIVQSMQCKAIAFVVTRILDEQQLSPDNKTVAEAKCLRNALFHSKGFIEEDELAPNQGKGDQLRARHQEMLKFASDFLDSLGNPLSKKLAGNPFYKRGMAHGLILRTRLEEISDEDSLHYIACLRAQFIQYNLPVNLPIGEPVYNNAMIMLLENFQIYTDIVIDPQVASWRHNKPVPKDALPTVALGVARQLAT